MPVARNNTTRKSERRIKTKKIGGIPSASTVVAIVTESRLSGQTTERLETRRHLDPASMRRRIISGTMSTCRIR